MIVPEYWAEARVVHRAGNSQITMRRFGWSETSQQDAQASADLRAREALARAVAGEKLPRREPKIPYNGAAGVPIREECLERLGETAITRNSYGARCLNTPSVVFADVDLSTGTSLRVTVAIFAGLIALALAVGSQTGSKLVVAVLVIAASVGAAPLSRALQALWQQARGGVEAMARARISRFLAANPDWGLRVYRTPAGLRVMVTHQTFNARDPLITSFFAAIGTDPVYVRMCLNQNCFRARLSPKPWRIGIPGHLRPRPGVWPVAPERLPERNAWIDDYERKAEQFAACRFVEAVGNGIVHPEVQPVMELHDARAGAASERPLA